MNGRSKQWEERCAVGLSPCSGAWMVSGKPCGYREVRAEFKIPEWNLAGLKARIDALCKRAKRLKCAVPSIEIGEPSAKSIGEGRSILVYSVTIRGESPRLNGWAFIATVDHDGEENIIRAMGGVESVPAQYRTEGPTCDHCRTNRRRTETFILHHEDGRFARVGRQCLKDFLGHENPASLAAAAEILALAMGAAGDMDDLGGYGGGSYGHPDTGCFLAYVAAAIRTCGWTSRKDEDPSMGRMATATIADQWCSEKDKSKRTDPSDEDRETARLALEWASSIGEDGSEVNDFMHNLRAASKRAVAMPKNIGITAYIVQGYLRAVAAKIEAEKAKASEFIGTVGARFGGKSTKKNPAPPAIELTVLRVITLDGQFVSYINVMVDDAGNSFKWKGSTPLMTGQRYRITGTIKAHEEYRGVKQTVLTRCDAEKIDMAA